MRDGIKLTREQQSELMEAIKRCATIDLVGVMYTAAHAFNDDYVEMMNEGIIAPDDSAMSAAVINFIIIYDLIAKRQLLEKQTQAKRN